MASPEVAEVPSKSAHTAMVTVMARILAGGTGTGIGNETRRHIRTKREERQTQTRTKRRKLQEGTFEPNSHSRFQHGDADLSSGSESDNIIGHITGPSASDSGPTDVVKQCHKLPIEWSVEDERLLQRMATRGGL